MGTFDKCPKSNLNFDNPRWAGFPQNSNSKFGRGSAQILNLNFAAPAGPARPGQLFRAPAAKFSPPGAAKILWPGCGKVAARATLSLKVARFLNYVLFYTPPRNIRHWDQNSIFSVFFHHGYVFVL